MKGSDWIFFSELFRAFLLLDCCCQNLLSSLEILCAPTHRSISYYTPCLWHAFLMDCSIIFSDRLSVFIRLWIDRGRPSAYQLLSCKGIFQLQKRFAAFEERSARLVVFSVCKWSMIRSNGWNEWVEVKPQNPNNQWIAWLLGWMSSLKCENLVEKSVNGDDKTKNVIWFYWFPFHYSIAIFF